MILGRSLNLFLTLIQFINKELQNYKYLFIVIILDFIKEHNE